ncbi:hypothetical protein GW17_00014481 [Ensete ventricosum]|nr:hypothetical protein GW17_00014481 [Ensete ventricosum]RZS20696.1 hypothetical protein BHM03_00053250 [Ensete ventricosum]
MAKKRRNKFLGKPNKDTSKPCPVDRATSVYDKPSFEVRTPLVERNNIETEEGVAAVKAAIAAEERDAGDRGIELEEEETPGLEAEEASMDHRFRSDSLGKISGMDPRFGSGKLSLIRDRILDPCIIRHGISDTDLISKTSLSDWRFYKDPP